MSRLKNTVYALHFGIVHCFLYVRVEHDVNRNVMQEIATLD
jgi:hypothetical protein